MTTNRMFPVSLDEELAGIRRELGFRERCYPRWVDSGKMTQKKADHENERLGGEMTELTIIIAAGLKSIIFMLALIATGVWFIVLTNFFILGGKND